MCQGNEAERIETKGNVWTAKEVGSRMETGTKTSVVSKLATSADEYGYRKG